MGVKIETGRNIDHHTEKVANNPELLLALHQLMIAVSQEIGDNIDPENSQLTVHDQKLGIIILGLVDGELLIEQEDPTY